MALADSYAVGFTQPLMMTLLAIPLLGERIRWRRMASTVVGFGGVLIMVRPGGDLWTPTVALLMLGVLGMSIGRILTRLLSTTETPESLALLPLLVHVPIGLMFLPFFPVHGFAWDALVAVVLVGIFNSTGHWLNARAYALAPVAALAPYEYTPLLWGGILAYFLFHEVPHASALAGAAVVAGAALYNLHREQLRRRDEAAAGVAPLLPRAAP